MGDVGEQYSWYCTRNKYVSVTDDTVGWVMLVNSTAGTAPETSMSVSLMTLRVMLVNSTAGTAPETSMSVSLMTLRVMLVNSTAGAAPERNLMTAKRAQF